MATDIDQNIPQGSSPAFGVPELDGSHADADAPHQTPEEPAQKPPSKEQQGGSGKGVAGRQSQDEGGADDAAVEKDVGSRPPDGGGAGTADEEALDLAAFVRRQLNAVSRGKQTKGEQKQKAEESGALDKSEPEKEQPAQKEDSSAEETTAQSAKEPSLDIEAIAAAAAKAAAMAISQQPKEQAAEPKEAEDEESSFIKSLDASEQRRIAVLEKMESLYPDKYKDIRKRYIASLKEAASYASKWLEENPGEEWNDSDHEQELEDIARKHGVDWDDEDYAEAIAEIKAEEKLRKVYDELEQRVGEVQKKQLEKQKIAAEIAEAVDADTRRAVEQLKKHGILTTDIFDRKGRLDTRAMESLKQEDPIAYQAVVSFIGGGLVNASTEVRNLWRGVTSFDPKNQMHVWLDKVVAEAEQKIKQLPPQKRIVDGKEFATLSEYAAMKPEQRAKYWTISEDDAAAIVEAHFVASAKNWYEEQANMAKAWAEKRLGVSPANKQDTQKPKNEGNSDKLESPPATPMPRAAGNRSANNKSGDDPFERFTRTFLEV